MRTGLVAQFLCSFSRMAPPPDPGSLCFDQKVCGGPWDYSFSHMNEQRSKVTSWRIQWIFVVHNNLGTVCNSRWGSTRYSPALLSILSEHILGRTLWEKQVSTTGIFEARSTVPGRHVYFIPYFSKPFRRCTEELGTEHAGQQLSPFCYKSNISVLRKAKTIFLLTSGGPRLSWLLLWFLARYSPPLNISSKPEPSQIAIKVPILGTPDHLVSFISFLSFEWGGNYVSLHGYL